MKQKNRLNELLEFTIVAGAQDESFSGRSSSQPSQPSYLGKEVLVLLSE